MYSWMPCGLVEMPAPCCATMTQTELEKPGCDVFHKLMNLTEDEINDLSEFLSEWSTFRLELHDMRKTRDRRY